MKNWLILLILLSIIVPFYSTAQVQVPGVSLKEAMVQNELTIDIESKQKKEMLSEIIILPKRKYDKESAEDMILRIGSIHPNILKEISASGVKLKLFNGKLTDEPMFTHLRGKTPKGWSNDATWEQSPGAGGGYVAAAKIGNSAYGDGHGSINLELHELAHSYAQKVYGDTRLKADFSSIWKEEAPKLFSERAYFLNYMEEYFAETFAMYYYSGASNLELKKNAPKTYQFFKKMEKRPYKWFASISPKL
ncbi:hypothetical protein LC040_08790 [Bacillus tianshenii]|nr:hypothetical protein LC040_08790 [Bacillus tianshenii]